MSMSASAVRKWQAFAILSIGALAASLILNYKLFMTSGEFYKRELEMRLSPLDLDRPLPHPTGVKSGRRVVFYGDSRAEQWPPPTVRAEFLNLGISGQTTTQILGRFDEQLAPAKPDIVVIQAGVNDLKAVAVMPERSQEIVDGVKSNLREIVSRVKSIGATPILTTVFPRGPVATIDRLRWNDDAERAIEEVNTMIRKEFPDNLDAAEILSTGKREVISGLGYDLLHLSPAGYEVLNVELTKRLDRELLSLSKASESRQK